MAEAKVPIYGVDGSIKGDIVLPDVFSTPVRPDLIKRAVLSIQSKNFQPKGRDPMAGKRTTAESFGVGLGMARIPRVKARGTPRGGQGAFAPGTVGGRLAHPPRAEKVIVKRINRKEKRLALKSAIAAAAIRKLVEGRGHKLGKVETLPIVVEDSLEQISTTKEFRRFLENLGLKEELERVEEGVKVRAGKGKRRGRRLKRKKGPLIVVSGSCPAIKAARNIPGVDICPVDRLNVELLAPGTHPGRLTIWTESAIEKLRRSS